MPCPITPKNHFLNSHDTADIGPWFRADPGLHALWMGARTRQHSQLTREGFAALIEGSLPPAGGPYFAVTYAPDATTCIPDLVAWQIDATGARPVPLEVEPECVGIGQLLQTWPVREAAAAAVMVVGVGSIGAVAAHSLATYGIGRLLLLDPDLLTWHNLVRHRSGGREVGNLKVAAVREELLLSRPDTCVDAHDLDIVTHADQVRCLLPQVDLLLCCTDGVISRRTASHLARRAGRPAVLACVLEDGAIGEVMRLRPWPDHGCLSCRREQLQEIGGLDPEPALDLGYGTGTTHRPTTAVGGDLHLVGQLAATVAIATILERAGRAEHRLRGEHALLGLRPMGDLAAPFDLQRALELRWRPATPPRPGCPTCEPA